MTLRASTANDELWAYLFMFLVLLIIGLIITGIQLLMKRFNRSDSMDQFVQAMDESE